MDADAIVDRGAKRTITVDGRAQDFDFKLKMKGVYTLAGKYGDLTGAWKRFAEALLEEKKDPKTGKVEYLAKPMTQASIEVLCDWIHACLIHYRPDLKLEDVFDMVDLSNLAGFIQGCTDAFIEGTPKPTGGAGPLA